MFKIVEFTLCLINIVRIDLLADCEVVGIKNKSRITVNDVKGIHNHTKIIGSKTDP